jgi:hypothetical protein
MKERGKEKEAIKRGAELEDTYQIRCYRCMARPEELLAKTKRSKR